MVTFTHVGCSEVLLFSISYLAYLFTSTAYGKIDADDMLVAWENDDKGHILKCLSYSLLPCSNQPVRLSYPLLSPASLVPTNRHINESPLEMPPPLPYDPSAVCFLPIPTLNPSDIYVFSVTAPRIPTSAGENHNHALFVASCFLCEWCFWVFSLSFLRFPSHCPWGYSKVYWSSHISRLHLQLLHQTKPISPGKSRPAGHHLQCEISIFRCILISLPPVLGEGLLPQRPTSPLL